MISPIELYLDLLKRSLTNWLHADAETRDVPAESFVRPELLGAFRAKQLRVVQPQRFEPQAREEGRDWPPTALTMIGMKRLHHLQNCVERVLRDKVPGDLIETGVWRGGACILMRAVLKAHAISDRRVWVADSFAGVPPPDTSKYPQDAGMELHKFPYLAVSAEQVKAHFERYGLLDAQVQFLVGWFRDTLPNLPAAKLAVARLDGDLYESTLDALSNLYPKLSCGGYLIVDDYGVIEACRRAVHDYRSRHGISEPIEPIDHSGVFWRRAR